MRSLLRSMLVKLGVYHFAYYNIWENRLSFRVWTCAWRYRNLVKKARNKPKTGKIRVLFIVNEIAKWKEQFLYEMMDKSEDFFPIVGISAWNNQSELNLSATEYKTVQENAEKFFDKLGNRHVRTVTIEQGKWIYHDLSEFNPDIVFYTEQWGPCLKQHPYEVSRYALTCFLPYYVPDFGIADIDCYQQVERMVWTYFCLSEAWVKLYRNSLRFVCYAAKFVATGHPALDYFLANQKRPFKEGYVIYAPHFSFYRPLHDGKYMIGTFDWNGVEILEYAERHPEIKWIFKPHPLLRRSILECGKMTKDEVDSYYERWNKIAQVSLDGNYQELFLESRAMITDCGSFLPEYGSTGRPIIRMICAHNKHIPPAAPKKVYDTYYQVHNVEELLNAFKLVIEDGKDPKLEERMEAIREAGLYATNASRNIIDYILKMFGRDSSHGLMSSSCKRDGDGY